MESDGKMGVHLDGSRGVGVSRLEVIEGPSGRRRRTKAVRARITAESLMPGVKIADVALQHGTPPGTPSDLTNQRPLQKQLDKHS